MACACKVNQQIDYLHKKYGVNVPKSKTKKINFDFGLFMENLGLGILVIPFIPFILLHIIIKSLSKDKRISVKKLIHITKKG